MYLDQVIDDVPSAMKPRVQYVQAADGLHVTLALIQDGAPLISKTLVVPSDTPGAAKIIAEEIVRVAIAAGGVS